MIEKDERFWGRATLFCVGLLIVIVFVALIFSGCGDGEQTTTTTKMTPPVNVIDNHGQYEVNVKTAEQADAQCEQLQSAWPDTIRADQVYFFDADRKTLLTCGAP